MSRGGAFLGDARSRLLPVSIPLRFFGAATLFHLLAWIALAASAGEWLDFGDGLGWPLATLHLVALGVLGMTTLGAGAQLLPVATRQPVPGAHWMAAIWWLYTPGVALLALGMGWPQTQWLAAGAVAVGLAFAAWGVLVIRNLRGARGMPGVVSHGWVALTALAVLLASALSLAGTWLGLPVPRREIALGLHLVFAPYGFMGALALGLSYILVPMFALAEAPAERSQLISCALAALSLLLAGIAAFGWEPVPLRIAALLAGAGAVGLHLKLMARTLRTGMRRELGRSFALVKIGWGGLAASLVLALALVLELPIPRLPAWLGLCLVGVWLLSFLLGMLERILPFLGAMYAAGTARRAPTPSALTDERALRVHFACHVAALAGLALALAAGSAWIATAAALVGVVGALAFCVFYARLLARMQRAGS
ncbi:MAG TPA: hypothetical protein VKP68_08420, partial [Ramlibacter sp.]|nr:hypothetical protein [Ramlibacter sp.]